MNLNIKPTYQKVRKALKLQKKKNYIICIIIIFIALGTLGSFWQSYMLKKDIKTASAPGKLYDVNSHKIHLYGIGEGDITLVFMTGSGTPCAYTDFYNLQRNFSKTYRTISYDKAGFGWSESTLEARSIEILTDELHKLLELSGEKPPFVLVGHSLASLEVIHYAQSYPEDVKGIILMDSGSPEYYLQYSEKSSILLNRVTSFFKGIGLVRFLSKLNILLPIVGESDRYNLLPQDMRQIDLVMYNNKIGLKDNLSVLQEINNNAAVVINNGHLKDIPLLILYANSDNEWVAIQNELINWSNISTKKMMSNIGHYIHWTNIDEVIKEINLFLDTYIDS